MQSIAPTVKCNQKQASINLNGLVCLGNCCAEFALIGDCRKDLGRKLQTEDFMSIVISRLLLKWRGEAVVLFAVSLGWSELLNLWFLLWGCGWGGGWWLPSWRPRTTTMPTVVSVVPAAGPPLVIVLLIPRHDAMNESTTACYEHETQSCNMSLSEESFCQHKHMKAKCKCIFQRDIKHTRGHLNYFNNKAECRSHRRILLLRLLFESRYVAHELT